ncbi:hypothetical protein M9Y10_009516 [Tritrichomonas musculus]|uniref:Ankyrin repeat protein n=1 Tax=Tritrichomonas musculus TaxID=1915356 RepID=A0ABR2INL0_9EUKA
MIDTISKFLYNKHDIDIQIEFERKTDDDGATPLHMAVSSGDNDLILYLLNQGCDTNSKNNQGQTPLHLAMSFTDSFIARALLAYNADLSIRDDHGKIPYEIAKIRGNENLKDTMFFYQNQEERPDRDEIYSEMAQRQVSNTQKMKIIAFRNNEIAKKKFLSKAHPNQNLNLNSILEDENQRFQDIESKIEELNDSVTKLETKILTSPQSALLTRSNHQCLGCFSTNTTVCPSCNLPYCEICMKKPKFHKCVENH